MCYPCHCEGAEGDCGNLRFKTVVIASVARQSSFLKQLSLRAQRGNLRYYYKKIL